MAKDYYKILEVNKNDSEETIKKSYKKLALKYHPDRADDHKKKEFEEKFKEINEAYNVLSNETKRKQYDAGGTNSQFRQTQSSGRQNFSDIFEDLLRGTNFGSQFSDHEEESEDLDLHYQITITFTEAAFGVEKEILIKKDVHCDSCNGTGAHDDEFDTCKKCNGHGRIEIEQRTPWGLMRRTAKCNECEGQGKIPKNKCKTCKGKGIINKKEKVKIKTPKGIDNNQTLRIPNAGNAAKNKRNGDLFLTIKVTPHKVFKRERFDIYMEQPITFSEAALGSEISIPTLTGNIKIKIAKGTESGSVLRLRDKGIPYLDDPSYLGDQYVNIVVKTPKKLTRAQAKLFEELKKLDK